ncbi:protein unc-50 homolog [Lingula anatina]|uniref:Protein unc-50 homolog n=1 Tax=Lingula anatina TaxID=7574 RepID=A0A1S3IAH2_LINAN|nr:protein unc-50 homolog [Lingula anatina]|eukprot:XP_013395265.1 protein unc-50 homolog [Lingula anatina]
MQSYTKTSPPPSPQPGEATLYMNMHTSHTSPTMSQRCSDLALSAKKYRYFKRLFKFRQMDFEYAFWQMIYLFIAPQKVYRNFQYRKQTKDQWARDDPAFLVLLGFCLCGSSIGFALVLGLGFFNFLKFTIWVIFVDCIGMGLLVASIFWFVANRYLVAIPNRGQEVEFGYAFDVHLNAFFPVLMILHVFQLPFLYFINANHQSFLSYFFGNTLWLVAVGYYVYITFLGYSALPFLKKAQVLLSPMMGLVIFYILSIAFGWNFTRYLCNFYHYRVWSPY